MTEFHLHNGQHITETVFVEGEYSLDIVLPENASLELILILLPGCGADIGIAASLTGAGASLDISSATFAAAHDRFSIRTNVAHCAPGASSNQIFKNIAVGDSRVEFAGRIKVEEGSASTEAYQQCHSLLLSDSAVVTTCPELEIYADDVKCSHGATVGRINEDELFYMRSRGIGEQVAKSLLEKSFLFEVVDKIQDESLRAQVQTKFETAFEQYPGI
ncbi:MAG: SufD family Fe-S cluster assembly protein [Bacteroidales bacterium]|nr:SufD family Fe-S cluster assembly protein [Bacteroidales bacterium]